MRYPGYGSSVVASVIIFVVFSAFACSKTQVKDDLARYSKENARLGQPAAGERRVVFFGDSITENWELEELFPGKKYINRGIHSETTAHMLARFQADVLDLKPKAVVILAGTNDINEKIPEQVSIANLAKMGKLAKEHGIDAIFCTLPPVRDIETRFGISTPNSKLRPPEKIKSLNSWIFEYAPKSGFGYVDYYSAMADEKGMLKAELSNDGLHPNAKGYAVMKPLVEKAIAETVK